MPSRGVPANDSAPRRCRVSCIRSPAETLAEFFAEDVISPDEPVDPVLSEGKSAAERCQDHIAFEPDSELQAAARELPEWRAHLLTLRFIYFPTLTKEACKVWRVQRASAAQHRPVTSDIPTLMLTGDWDGVVSPVSQRGITRTLPNSFYVELPGTGHFTLAFDHFEFGNDCPAEVMAALSMHQQAHPTPAARPRYPRSTSRHKQPREEVAIGTHSHPLARQPVGTPPNPSCCSGLAAEYRDDDPEGEEEQGHGEYPGSMLVAVGPQIGGDHETRDDENRGDVAGAHDPFGRLGRSAGRTIRHLPGENSHRGSGDRGPPSTGEGLHGGPEVEMRFAQIRTFRDGRGTRMELYADPDQALEAAGLSE
jgi:TAP-like protein